MVKTKKYTGSIVAFLFTFVTSNAQTDSIHTSIKEVTIVADAPKKVEIANLDLPIKYLPISVNTISSQTLKIRGIVNIQDAMKFFPGVRMKTSYGAFQQLAVRGFDFTPMMIDGIRDERTSINNSAPFPDLSSIQSVELLKGPASVLYGHSTIGGILNVVRKAPQPHQTIETRLSYGSWNNQQAMIDFGGKIYKTLNYRTIINWSDNEGYRYTNDKRFSGYIAFNAKPSKQQEIDIRGGFNRDNYGTEIGLPPTMPEDIYNTDGSLYLKKGQIQPNIKRRWRYNNESDFMQNNGLNFMVKYRYRFSKTFNLENLVSYNYDDINYFGTEVLTYRENSRPTYNHYYLKENKKQYIDIDTVCIDSPLRFAFSLNVISNQLRLSGKQTWGKTKYNYLIGYGFVGMFRNSYTGYDLQNDIAGPGLNSKIPVRLPHSMGYMTSRFSKANITQTYTHSLYIQNLFELSKQFRLMLAGRYDYFDYRKAAADVIDGKRKHTNRQPFSQTSNSALTYRIGTVYLPTPTLSLYGSLANFFSPYRDLYNPKTIYIDAKGNQFYPKDGDEIFKPQTGYQAEVGIKYTYQTLLQATGSLYYIKKNNEKKRLATLVEDDIQKTVVGQVGQSDAKGFELELTLTPTSYTALSTGYAYTDARIRNLKKNDYLSQETYDNQHQAGIPINTYFASGDYKIIRGLLKNLAFNLTISYTDHVYRNINKDIIYPAYWLTDIGASYALNNGITLSININNLFNESYYNQSLGRQITPSAPTNCLFTLAYKLANP